VIDTNVYLGHWPFRRHGYEETSKLVAKLHAVGITQAWVGSFEGLLHKDLAGVNSRLAAECARKGDVKLVPFGSVNPRLPAWEEDVRRCREEHKMPGVRLHPGYHGYKLDDALAHAVLTECERHGLIAQIVARMEDERTQHPLMPVPPVDLKPLPELLLKHPDLRVQVLNSSIDVRGEALVPLVRGGKVYFDFAMLESVGAVARLIERIGLGRIVFGSHFPLYHVESAILKIKEAGLKEADVNAIRDDNARALLGQR
jgi:predicted TIM-barrel fold metal-dependent hydrolase